MADLDTVVGTEGLQESAENDLPQAPAEEADNSISLAEALGEAEEGGQPQEAAGQESGEQGSKPVSGGIKGRLLESEKKGHDRGYQEGLAAGRAEIEAKYQADMQKYQEWQLERDAKELAAKEGCTESLALRILRAERGIAPPAENAAQAPAQPRDEKGRFVAQSAQPTEVDAKAQQLFEQAKSIQRMGGVDVLQLFNDNAEIRQKVANGEMDFFDVAREYGNKPQKKAAPPVTRGGQPGSSAGRSFKDLSDEQFDRIWNQLDGGAVIDMRR